MILQALYLYSERLRRYQAEHPKAIALTGGALPSRGMEWRSIPYRIVLQPDGTFSGIRRANDEEHEVAKFNDRSNDTKPLILWDYLDYVLGVGTSLTEQKPERDKKRFNAFVQKIYSLPDEIEAFRIVKLFYKREEYLKAQEHELIKEIQSKKGKVPLSFELEGSTGLLLTEDSEVKAYLDPTKRPNETLSKGVCLVTGMANQPILENHEKVTVGGVLSCLVAFDKNSKAYNSYLKSEGLNAPISQIAGDSIGTALRHLLQKGQPTNYNLGGTTYLFWNSSFDPNLQKNYFLASFEGVTNEEPENKETNSSPSCENPRKKVVQVLDALNSIYTQKRIVESKERFYILGLMGKKGRHAVKLFVEGSVREIVGNTLQHIQDMNIVALDGSLDEDYPLPRSLSRLMKYLVHNESLDRLSENLMQDFVHSIVCDIPYPASVQKLCLDRIRRDHKANKWAWEYRAAILKGYLNRKYRQLNKTEIVTMALDRTQTNRAYLAGRLFALLEKIQEDAHWWSNRERLKTTIRTRYYSVASTYPNNIFGRLMGLSGHHMNKLRAYNVARANKLSEEQDAIFALIPGKSPQFPIRFSPDEQSLFAVGYYHQRSALWSKQEDEENDTLD